MESKAQKKYTIWKNINYVILGTWNYSKLLFVYYGVFTIFTFVQPFIVIFFPKFIIDELTGLQRPSMLILLLAMMFLLSSIIGFITEYLEHLSKTQIMQVTFKFIYKHTEKNLSTDFKNTENPNFLNKMENARRSLFSVNNGLQGMLNILFSFGGGVIAFAGYITIVATLNPLILLFLIITILCSYYFTLKVKKYEHSKSDEISENDRRSGYAYGIMYDFAYGKDLRIYNLANIIASKYKMAKENHLKILKNIKYQYLIIGVIDVILLLLREGIVYAYLIHLFIKSEITIGNFTMYFVTIAGLTIGMQRLMNDIAQMRAQNLYINDLRNYLESINEKGTENPLSIQNAPYSIEFKNVSFKYPNSENYVYKNFSITIPAKQRLAIVGHNGAGKTTFIKLLCRLYEPDEGEILINGINIRGFSKEKYFTLFSAVFQEINILAFSVSENIAIAENEMIDYEKINEIIEKSDLINKISSLKNGVNTSMYKFLDDEGIEFSGGENQKVALARALYKDGDIVVLDEPTAALDALAEYNIYNRFNDLIGNKTAIYISHRLSSTRFCDKIAFIENGELIEYGTHTELLFKNEKYAEMFNIQAQYYKNGGNEN